MDIILKLSLKELELMIEIMERNRHDNDPETSLRSDLKKIRSNAEDRINLKQQEMADKPDESKRLMPDPITRDED
tara:strand:+ start:1502 stop:1726 length:225 start_codon:yes stop_codon:yes gene_type:complete